MALPRNKETAIATLSVAAIIATLVLGQTSALTVQFGPFRASDVPLLVALVLGGGVLVFGLAKDLVNGQFGSDLLAGISIVTSVLLKEYLAGTLVVLMLSGGQALESYAIRSASSVLELLAKRLPAVAHVKRNGAVSDVALDQVKVGELVSIFPHEISPVDGFVTEGHGSMDESYLTGEPYVMSKAPGSAVLSGAINGESALTIQASKLAIDSRYSKVMDVMRSSAQHKPRLRRIADQLGAIYTPVAVSIAIAAWLWSGESTRFLAVVVIATPCPLLIGIPVVIIGSISLAARRGIIIKDPSVLERIDTCRVAIFDKTGTLTYGKPNLTEIIVRPGFDRKEILFLAASLERYSKHPLAAAILETAQKDGITLGEVGEMSERPGAGLQGEVTKRRVEVTGRAQLLARSPETSALLPEAVGGMECTILVDGAYAATFRFRDEPRGGSRSFIDHLSPKHKFLRVMIVSGDRESEVKYLSEKVGIKEIYFSQSPEEKLELVRRETKAASTLFLGDGINDAPALTAATVGVAFGQASDITSEAAGAVVLDNSLEKVDELLHISRRMRAIALQTAWGGMALSLVGMGLAFIGLLPPVTGAITQEVIDVLAVLNALRVAIVPKVLTDY